MRNYLFERSIHIKIVREFLVLLLASTFFIVIFPAVWADDYGVDETTKQQAGNAWIKIIYDPGVSLATRKNAQKSADIITALLARYGMPLVQPVTAIITADTEAFLNAIISTGNMSRATAEKWFKGNLGASFGKSDTIVMKLYPIVIKGQPRQENNISETLTILSHEIFHQAVRQYLKNVGPHTWTWLSEGTAEYFRSMALEESGVVNANVMLRYAEQNIRKAASIPDVYRLLDSTEYRILARERLPVYYMSQVMISRLIQNKDFGKVAAFYKFINAGTPPDKAFSDTFGIPLSVFLDEMNIYFKTQLRTGV